MKFDELVEMGLDAQMLIDAARKLAKDEADRGNVGTRYIPQAVTWLNQQRWSDYAESAVKESTTDVTADESQLEYAVKFYAQTGVWSRYAGPEPGLSGCRVSSELLVKHGLGPDGRRLAPKAA
ncbi:hypothetical protein ACFFWD_22980 [Bradyrhizobium erythrophlei]|uniref:hypothetical protein n=1 Tax=Bradyrhizobium erythrophlei TaxID=1437360 RepID=UPI0035EF0ABF